MLNLLNELHNKKNSALQLQQQSLVSKCRGQPQILPCHSILLKIIFFVSNKIFYHPIKNQTIHQQQKSTITTKTKA